MKQFEHNGIKYHNFYGRSKYKYVLDRSYGIYVDIKPADLRQIDGFVTLKMDGKLLIREGYAWDGPSGPTIDTRDFMRGSLVHDALYQLIRDSELNPAFREEADGVLYDLCRSDGMPAWRAWYVWLSVRLFGGAHA